MKKYLILTLSILLAVTCLFACGKDEEKGSEPEDNDISAEGLMFNLVYNDPDFDSADIILKEDGTFSAAYRAEQTVSGEELAYAIDLEDASELVIVNTITETGTYERKDSELLCVTESVVVAFDISGENKADYIKFAQKQWESSDVDYEKDSLEYQLIQAMISGKSNKLTPQQFAESDIIPIAYPYCAEKSFIIFDTSSEADNAYISLLRFTDDEYKIFEYDLTSEDAPDLLSSRYYYGDSYDEDVYYPDGLVKKSTTYSDGVVTSVVEYSENGNILYQCSYDDSGSNVISEEIYYESGCLKSFTTINSYDGTTENFFLEESEIYSQSYNIDSGICNWADSFIMHYPDYDIKVKNSQPNYFECVYRVGEDTVCEQYSSDFQPQVSIDGLTAIEVYRDYWEVCDSIKVTHNNETVEYTRYSDRDAYDNFFETGVLPAGVSLYLDTRCWNLTGSKDADNNSCPLMVPVNDTTPYRDSEEPDETSQYAWMSAADIIDYCRENNYSFFKYLYVCKP